MASALCYVRQVALTREAGGSSVNIRHHGDPDRAIPAFSFAAPPEWLIARVGDGLIIGTPADDTDNWASVVLEHREVPPPFELSDAAAATWVDVMAESPDATIGSQRRYRPHDIDFYLRLVDFPVTNERVKPVTAAHILFLGPQVEGAPVQVWQFACMAPADQFEEFAPTFVALADTFRFGDEGDETVG